MIAQLKTELDKKFGKKKSRSLLQQVLVPSRETYFARERKNLEEIAKLVAENQKLRKAFRLGNIKKIEQEINDTVKIKKLLDKHVAVFGFTSFALHLGAPLSIANLLERIISWLQEDTKNKTKFTQLKIKEDKEKTEDALSQIAPFPKIYERVILAQELMFWKNQRLDILFKSDLSVKPLFDAIAGNMSLTYQEFVYLSYEEINNWLIKNKKPPSNGVIYQRMQSYCLYLKDGKVSLLIDKEKYPLVSNDKKIGVAKKSNTALKGTTAYRGKVSGKVRLVFSLEDIKKVLSGEILVATMTRPEMIVGLERAAAFVTDQGGMLCHAAILSREMRKPCIVGTKVATKILKDGDIIEVDANNARVRIIKRT